MGESKKYFWLKLKRDFFKRHDIQIIEAMPNGKDYILFYLKLLCESVDHEGRLRFSEQIPYNEHMLSTITNTNIDIVRAATKVFTELGMMEMLDDGTLFMLDTQKMVGSASQDEHTRESTRLRVQAFRERKKQALIEEKRYSNATCNGEIEKEIEINKEINKEIKIGEEIETVNTTVFNEKVELWNSLSTLGIAPIRSITANGKRATFLRARFKEYGEDSFKEVVQAIRESSFLQGKHSGKPWQVTFDWVILPSNYPKVLEGNYKDCEKRSTTDWSQIN